MDGAVFFIFIISTVIFFAVLYFAIKLGVREGIIEAHREIEKRKREEDSYIQSVKNQNQIKQNLCPSCKRAYDMDYPKCPHCGAYNALV